MVDVKWLMALVAAAALSSISAAEDEDRESAKRVEELAGRYDFYADTDLKTKVERHKEPLLKYTNPVQGQVYGNVFVWTHQGRPEVIGALFDHRSQGTLYAELHTLARPGVVACRDGKVFLKPSNAGVTFKPVPGGFAHALDLIRFVKGRQHFAIGAAGYPEGHIECSDKILDWDRAAAKVEAGADFLITQLFYEPNDFLEFADYLKNRRGITVPIVPGLMPFLKYAPAGEPITM